MIKSGAVENHSRGDKEQAKPNVFIYKLSCKNVNLKREKWRIIIYV